MRISINNYKSKETNDTLHKLLPFLFFIPETERLFLSSPSARRNFIDSFIFTYNKNYNKLVNQYNKNLLDRSKLLSNENYDHIWLDQIEKNIAKCGLEIYLSRINQVSILLENLNFFIKKFGLFDSINATLSDKFYDENIN